MHLWLFSSGGALNNYIDEQMLGYLRNKEPLLVFVPSSYDTADYYYDEFVERYSALGVSRFEVVHLDRGPKHFDADLLASADLIYLSGGNTFYFLQKCREMDLFEILNKFIERGGVVAGHSAGAILMTPVITTASYPEDDRDENTVEITDWTGAGLVQFEIYPHYDHTPHYYKALLGASHDTPHVIYGVPDGAAICINGPSISFFGEIRGFFNGEAFPIAGF